MGGASKQTSSVKIWQCHSGKLSCDDPSFSLAYSISKLAMPPRLLESSTNHPHQSFADSQRWYYYPKVEAPAVSDAEALQSLDLCHISSAATAPASVAVPADSTKVQESSIDTWLSQMPPELL